MRVIEILLVALLSANTAQVSASTSEKSEDEKSIYLNAYLEKVKTKNTAAYYCELVEESDRGFHYRAYFMSGELKMDGWYKDQAMTEPTGIFTYFYQSGQVESTGQYIEGVKYGLWERYDEDGNEKPEKIYASLQMMKAIAHRSRIK